MRRSLWAEIVWTYVDLSTTSDVASGLRQVLNPMNILHIFDDSNLRAASDRLQRTIDAALKMVPVVIAIGD